MKAFGEEVKTYPKIDKGIVNVNIYAFDKLDGSNIRSEWSKGKGFYKFGTRRQMINENSEIFGEAVGLIKDKYESDIAKIMKKFGQDRGVFFFEFFGKNSFAGLHSNQEPHDVILFDANFHKRGMLPPKEYLKMFGHLDIAKLLYFGKPNENFLKQVRDGTLSDMSCEGVVCKAAHPKKGRGVLMFKVKSEGWYSALKVKCAGDVALFESKA